MVVTSRLAVRSGDKPGATLGVGACRAATSRLMETEHSSAYSVPVFDVCTKLLFRCTASAFKVQQQRVTDVCIVFEDAWLCFRSGALGALHAEFATSS
jgi:hypothetical protein